MTSLSDLIRDGRELLQKEKTPWPSATSALVPLETRALADFARANLPALLDALETMQMEVTVLRTQNERLRNLMASELAALSAANFKLTNELDSYKRVADASVAHVGAGHYHPKEHPALFRTRADLVAALAALPPCTEGEQG